MPLYKYTAKDMHSAVVHGSAEEENEQALAMRLRSAGQFLISCKEVSNTEKSNYHPKANELADFAGELGTMLSSGITLIRAMNIILQSDLRPKQRILYQQVYQGLQRGQSFSEALEAQNGAFPLLMINMFRAGEATGKMDQAAKKVAVHYEKDHKVRSKIKNAMVYPVILICVAIFVMLGIFIFILPSFFDTFQQLDIELPGITKAVMAFSNLLTAHWAACLLAVIAILLAVIMLWQIPQVKWQVDKCKLKLPKVGKLLRTIYTARFARTLSTLYTSGLPMMQALRVAADTIGNRYIAGQFEQVIAEIRSGAPLSASLRLVDGFVSKLMSVTLIGEEAGRLDEMLDNMADSFDFESEKAIDRLVAMLEPAMIVILAIGVGTIMISVMLPLYTMYANMS